MKVQRTYHHCKHWEETPMWKSITGDEREILFRKAVEFTGNATLYGEWMMKVIELWPFSSEHNLSNSTMNRQAWIGHAATYLAIQCPEDITRAAWHTLTQKQQDDANAMADMAIAEWERRHKEDRRAKEKAPRQLSFRF